MVQGTRGFSVLFAAPTNPIDLGIFHQRRKTRQRSRSRNPGSMDYHRCVSAEKAPEKHSGMDAEPTDHCIARRVSTDGTTAGTPSRLTSSFGTRKRNTATSESLTIHKSRLKQQNNHGATTASSPKLLLFPKPTREVTPGWNYIDRCTLLVWWNGSRVNTASSPPIAPGHTCPSWQRSSC